MGMFYLKEFAILEGVWIGEDCDPPTIICKFKTLMVGRGN